MIEPPQLGGEKNRGIHFEGTSEEFIPKVQNAYPPFQNIQLKLENPSRS
jgi:hypothetical protein